MKADVRSFNPKLTGLEASCFDGQYITGDIDDALLDRLEQSRQAA
jgi:amidophosphoribosyltransferase